MNLNRLSFLKKFLIISALNIIVFVCFSTLTFAQKPLNPIMDKGPKSIIQLLRADSLIGDNSLSKTQTFMGNVIFLHQGVKLGCSIAIHNQSSNLIEAYGKIIINQGDTLTIVGDTLYYDGNLRKAQVLGKSVILRDKKVTLRTNKVFYDLNNDQAYYPNFGIIRQDSSTLSSNSGYYNTKTKFFNYIGDVEIINPSYVLCTDTLDYDTYSKQAFFKSPTTITSKDGKIKAYKGRYNIKTKVSFFEGRAMVSNNEYSLEGDTIRFDNAAESGYAIGNVVFKSFTDSVKVIANKGERKGPELLTIMMGETVTEKISGKDTVYIAADTLWIFEKNQNPIALKDTISKTILPDESLTLEKRKIELKTDVKEGNNRKDRKTTISKRKEAIDNTLKLKDASILDSLSKKTVQKDTISDSINNKIQNKESASDKKGKKDISKIIADGKVKVFRRDFQSVSDSLIYDLKDSIIYFFQSPIIWNADNQLEADTITIILRNNKLQKMELVQNSFVIAADTIKNNNQISGRNINAFFDSKSQLKTIKVDGNGESLYYALDDKNKMLGLNRVECGRMQFNFEDKKVRQITFIGNPESMLIPPNEVFQEDLNLDKFKIKADLKPNKESVKGKKFENLTKD